MTQPGTAKTYFSWAGVESEVAFVGRNQSSGRLGMGNAGWGASVNNGPTQHHFLTKGTWKIAVVGQTAPDAGITHVLIDGVDKGTMDWYDGAGAENVYKEILGIDVPISGNKKVELIASSKNGSSTNYNQYPDSIALIRTGGSDDPAITADTPGSYIELLPWAGAKAIVGTWGRLQGAGALGGGVYQNNGSQNQSDEVNWDVWFDPGTYKVTLIFDTDANHADHTIYGDSTSLGVIGGYSAGHVSNVYSEITGISIAAAAKVNARVVAATKNASSSGYLMQLLSLGLVRVA